MQPAPAFPMPSLWRQTGTPDLLPWTNASSVTADLELPDSMPRISTALGAFLAGYDAGMELWKVVVQLSSWDRIGCTPSPPAHHQMRGVRLVPICTESQGVGDGILYILDQRDLPPYGTGGLMTVTPLGVTVGPILEHLRMQFLLRSIFMMPLDWQSLCATLFLWLF